MKRILISIALASVMLSASVLAGPSAKFAATYGYGPSLSSVIDISGSEDVPLTLDARFGYKMATIKVPQGKELLVGVSAEIGITTDTSLKGKNGGAAKAIAGGGAAVVVVAFPVDGFVGEAAEPGFVVLSARVQTLNARLGGVIESCEDTTGGTDSEDRNPGDDGYIDTPDGVIDVKTECLVTDEEIGLVLETLAAHHFNFVLPDMDAGEYNIVAFFVTGAWGEIDIDETTFYEDDLGVANISASAYANAWIGKHMITVQQVRAVKDGLEAIEIIEP
jgi:hypothetical protein